MRMTHFVVAIGLMFPACALVAQSVATPAGMRKEIITDPVLGMTAFEVFVPTKWHFAGRLLQRDQL